MRELGRVMLAEDEEMLRNLYSMLIGQFLSDQDMLRVFASASAAEQAIQADERFSVIVTDKNFKNDPRTGYDLLRSARVVMPDVPIIIMSTDFVANPEERTLARRIGADEVFDKVSGVVVFQEIISRFIRQ